MLVRLAFRLATEISPRLAVKAGYLWAWKGMRAVAAYKRRVRRGELFPPFLFLALTDACNLRCHGCWIESHGKPQSLGAADVDAVIASAKRQRACFFTLLGGEPMLYPGLWDLIARHPDCYFQIITNGTFWSEENVERLRAAGNVTPLVSIDGLQEENDRRRGQGVFETAIEGLARLKRREILFGVATTVSGRNMDQVTGDEYVREFIRRGAMYLWYYVFRPVGADPSPEYCVSREQMIELRRRLLGLRRRHPIILIDTYWNAAGEAVCPAALGLGFHIGPGGGIEPCPPLRFACESIRDHGGDLFATINSSQFLRGFQQFVRERTRGCVILERPQELVEFLEESLSTGHQWPRLPGRASGRDQPHQPPPARRRDSRRCWFYRLLKKQLFFGMGGYG